MATITLAQMITELGRRLGDYVAVKTSKSSSLANELYCDDLIAFAPNTVDMPAWWVYYTTTTGALARSRAKSWDSTQKKITLLTDLPEFPVSGRDVELHPRIEREEKALALNSAVRKLGLFWYRDVVDESITTQAKTWRYTLPSTIVWSYISKIEIQATTTPGLSGYPYMDASAWSPIVYRDVSSTGVETWYLQFKALPPIGRKVRIYGEAMHNDVVNDGDRLSVSGAWFGSAIEWVYDWACFRLWEREGARNPSSVGDRYMFWTRDKLQRQLQALLMEAPVHKPARILVPGREGGISASDPAYLAVFRTSGFSS